MGEKRSGYRILLLLLQKLPRGRNPPISIRQPGFGRPEESLSTYNLTWDVQMSRTQSVFTDFESKVACPCLPTVNLIKLLT